MIRHICMFSLKEENKEANIAEFLRRGVEGLDHCLMTMVDTKVAPS